MDNSDVVVIGAGLVGLATGLALLRLSPRLTVTVIEKEPAIALHQSSHNSGVLHAGLYYKPGSSKAQLAVEGIRTMTRYCAEREIPFEQCGKLVVAVNESEVPRLRVLFERGQTNGLTGLRWLDPVEANEIEPHVRCVAAVQVPEEGIVDYPAVARSVAADITALGGAVRVNSEVIDAQREGRGWRLVTRSGDVSARFVVNCAGLHTDRIAALLGCADVPPIIPFRGDYFKLRPGSEHFVRNLIYPVPDPAFPFLGVHFTRLINGGVECGPSAVLALKREGYSRTDLSLRDAGRTLTYPGTWRFLRRHSGMVAAEFWRAASNAAFTRQLQRLLPVIQSSDLMPGGAGVRAQAISPDGRLVDDFLFREASGVLHVLNAPSPAATASLAIGERIANQVSRQLDFTTVS